MTELRFAKFKPGQIFPYRLQKCFMYKDVNSTRLIWFQNEPLFFCLYLYPIFEPEKYIGVQYVLIVVLGMNMDIKRKRQRNNRWILREVI